MLVVIKPVATLSNSEYLLLVVTFNNSYCRCSFLVNEILAISGSKCGGCVRTRVVRAFLIEEQKIVAKVLKAQAGKK